MNDSKVAAPSGAELSCWIAALAAPSPAVDDADRIGRIRQFEELKSALAAAQARETSAFVNSQRAAGGPEDRVDRGIAAQVALAKRCSPYQAQRYVGWAGILCAELPGTLAELEAGRTSEWRAMLVARETAWLARKHRAAVDRDLAPRLEHLGDRTTEREAALLAYRLDPEGAAERARRAEADRRVGIRPAPDSMACVTGLVPMAQGVAAWAALKSDADAKVAAGDARGRGQIMADTFIERLTGQTTAAAVPVEVQLVLPVETLLAAEGEPGRDEPAVITGFGPLPGPLAREWLRDSAAPVWLRRLFTAPGTGELIAMESRRRCFTPAQRRFIALRDQTCRTPWCNAPIRHIDHIQPAAAGGPTHVRNGQGYCAACNYAKQAPGWRTERVPPPGRHTVDTTTPTGHRYRSRAPDPPRTGHQNFQIRVDLRHYPRAA